MISMESQCYRATYSYSYEYEIENIPKIKVCKCTQCRAGKKNKSAKYRKFLKRMTSKWRRQFKSKFKNLYIK
jgi:hypothetical protein